MGFDMADIEQMKNALIKAHEAGDTEAASVIADEIRAALVETAIFDRCGDGKTAGIDTQTIIRAWAAASIRARVEIANRENAE